MQCSSKEVREHVIEICSFMEQADVVRCGSLACKMSTLTCVCGSLLTNYVVVRYFACNVWHMESSAADGMWSAGVCMIVRVSVSVSVNVQIK